MPRFSYTATISTALYWDYLQMMQVNLYLAVLDAFGVFILLQYCENRSRTWWWKSWSVNTGVCSLFSVYILFHTHRCTCLSLCSIHHPLKLLCFLFCCVSPLQRKYLCNYCSLWLSSEAVCCQTKLKCINVFSCSYCKSSSQDFLSNGGFYCIPLYLSCASRTKLWPVLWHKPVCQKIYSNVPRNSFLFLISVHQELMLPILSYFSLSGPYECLQTENEKSWCGGGCILYVSFLCMIAV